MNICAELWKTPFTQLLQKCSDVCHRGHGGTSVCVSSIKVHIWIHSTCNQGVHKWFKSNYGSVLVSVRWLLAHPVLCGRNLKSRQPLFFRWQIMNKFLSDISVNAVVLMQNLLVQQNCQITWICNPAHTNTLQPSCAAQRHKSSYFSVLQTDSM